MAEPSRFSIPSDQTLNITLDAELAMEMSLWEKASDEDFKSLDNTIDLGIEKLEQISYTPIVCRIDANVTVIGKSTKNVYVFHGGGAIVEVAEADVPDILSKRLGIKLCCGDENTNIMFEKQV